jgi:hypothetical protein
MNVYIKYDQDKYHNFLKLTYNFEIYICTIAQIKLLTNIKMTFVVLFVRM